MAIARAEACALGSHFGQHAVLVGDDDAPAEVCACAALEQAL